MHVVVGLGITGFSVVRHLVKIGVQDIIVMDTRANPPNAMELQQTFPHIKSYFGPLDLSIVLQADEIILSPGIALTTPEIKAALTKNIPVIGDIELFARAVSAPVVSITGTNGKSTVTTMIGDLARACGVKVAVGGNLGTGALDLLQDDIELYVLELSSFQLETTYSLKSAVAILLNVTEDHSDRYASIADYAKAKHRIFQHADLAVYNRADPLTLPNVSTTQSFGLDKPLGNDLGVVDHQLMCGDKKLFAVDALFSQRPNFINNALAALSCVCYFDWSIKVAEQVLHNFKGLVHRCQLVLNKNGIRWYNDSKATNVGATLAAIQDVAAEISGKQILIMGGDGKGADFSALREPLAQHAKHVVLFGKDAKQIAAILPQDFSHTFVNNLKQAVETSATIATQNDAVLLAPACASLDMFKDYRDRGEQFEGYVKEIA